MQRMEWRQSTWRIYTYFQSRVFGPFPQTVIGGKKVDVVNIKGVMGSGMLIECQIQIEVRKLTRPWIS